MKKAGQKADQQVVQPAARPQPLSRERAELLKRIREAKLPREAGEFAWEELCKFGLLDKYPRKEGIADATFKQLVLFAIQNEELRKQRDYFRKQLELHQEYHSPLWDALWKTECPLKAKELRERIAADEAKANQERRRRVRPSVEDILSIIGATRGNARNAEWRMRDNARRHSLPWEPAFWHEPMTIMDYSRATGLTRRQCSNIVSEVGGQPMASRKRPNAPALYSPEVNASVLCAWLKRFRNDREVLRARLVKMLSLYSHRAPKHEYWIIEALWPVLMTITDSPEKRRDFIDYLLDCERCLHPPMAPVSARHKTGVPPDSLYRAEIHDGFSGDQE